MSLFLRAVPAILVAGLLSSTAVLAQETARPGTIAIDGQGEVFAKPDTAYVESGVTSYGDSAREALDANSKDMAALIETLKAAGIEARDIQTSGFSVNPNYVYSNDVDENGYSLPPKINGYIVTNSVTVRVRDLEKLGAVLDQSVSVGANTINGVNFTVADPSGLLDEARKLAFADAREKAELYAGLAEVDLERLLSITESTGYSAPQPMMRQAAMEMAASPVPVEAGELSYTITVSVTWEVGDAE